MRKEYLFTNDWEFALVRGTSVNKENISGLHFEAVELPHDWMRTSPFNRSMEQGESQGFFDRWGCGWYRKDFLLEKQEGYSYRLRFDGVYENASVWVNNIPVGENHYGYSGFTLDISNALKDGANQVLVRVDNTTMPVDRWYTGAGIYRKVTLEVLPRLHFEREEIKVSVSCRENSAEIIIHTGLSNPAEGTQGRSVALGNPAGARADDFENPGRKELHVSSGADGLVRTGLKVCAELEGFSQKWNFEGSDILKGTISNPVLWSAETPNLYTLKLQLMKNTAPMETVPVNNILDEITIRIGIRSVTVDPDRGLFVNGENVKLKGMCLHQDAGCFGTAVQPEIWRERLQILKKMGCNALRFAHHLFMPELLNLCDELGFYIYEECFDKWTGGAYGRFYQTDWEKDIACMVKRDRNHPSILFWGVGNEVENQAYPSMLALLEKHIEKVKSLDDSRPVSVAMNPHFSYPGEEVDMSKVKDIQQFVDEMKTGEIFDVDERIVQIAKIAEKVDLLCCNYQEQWYEKIHKAIPDKAILGTETYMYFRGLEDKFQNFLEINPWHDVENLDYCIGGMMWTGIDYLGESMGYPAKGWSGAPFAIDMEPRPIADQFKSYWTKEPMISFAVMDYSMGDTGTKEHWDCPPYAAHWDFPQYDKTVLPFMIATNCEEVEIHVNEKQFLAKPVKEYPDHMVTGFLPYLKGKVTVIGKIAGKEVCRQEIRTPGPAAALIFDQEEIEIKPETKKYLICGKECERIVPKQCLLKVRAYDKEGIRTLRESAKVTFRVEGPARIIGVENGDIKSAEPFDNDFIHMYQGRADVGLLITGPGRIRVSAFAGGMKAAAMTVIQTDI